jgi:anti-sigma factor (TIGR02949 family)
MTNASERGTEGRERIGCEEALRRLAAFLDGELDRPEATEVERHLETCRSCYSRAEFERRLRDRLQSDLRPATVPAELEERVRRIVRGFTGESGAGSTDR